MWRLVKWLLILGIPIGGLAAAASYGKAYMKAKGVPKFTTAEVSRGKVETVVNSTGPVTPVRSVMVGAFISGPIAEILVDFNSIVKEGDLLARIDSRLQKSALDRERAALATQKAELARVEAQLQQAVNNEKRAENLRVVNKDYVSEQEMDQLHFNRVALDAQKKLAQANIEQAMASMKNAETNLGYAEIRSPVNGMVIERRVNQGQTVQSGYNVPEMFDIALEMDKHMYVYASVDEADIGQIIAAQKLSKPVSFTVDSYPDDIFEGKIFQIRLNGTSTQNVVTYPVVIEAPNPNLKLKPKMTANISFQIDVRENVLRVPTAALRYVPPTEFVRPEDHAILGPQKKKDPKEDEPKLSAGQRAAQAKSRNKRNVWVQDGEFLTAIPVTIGLSDGQFAEVLTGDLKEGLAVVTGTEGGSRENR